MERSVEATAAAPAGRLIAAAGRAPSSHNTQPWIFESIPAGLRLRADFSRRLPVNDPEDRELVVSCGAALLNLRVEAASAGIGLDVRLLPEPSDPGTLADVVFEPRVEPDSSLAPLGPAIRRRATCRSGFSGASPSRALKTALVESVVAEDALVRFVAGDSERATLAGFVEDGDRRQFAHRAWRRELAAWIKRPGAGEGLPRLAPRLARFFVTRLDLGRSVGRRDAKTIVDVPLIAMIGTSEDTRLDWLRAGQAVERALLVAALEGFQATWMNQPCQVAAIRSRLGEVFPEVGHPQLIVGFGRPRRRLRRRTGRRALKVI